MRSVCSALSLALLAACSSTGSTTRVTTTPTLFDAERGPIGIDVMHDTRDRADTIAIPMDRAWQALPEALAKLNMGIQSAIAQTHHLESRPTLFRGRMDNVRLSTYFDCGQSAMGNTADRYTVIVRLSAGLTEAKGGAVILRSVATGTAKPDDNASLPVQCSSTGRLEKRLRDLTSVLAASP